MILSFLSQIKKNVTNKMNMNNKIYRNDKSDKS